MLKQIDVYSSLLEGKQRQFLTKPDKIKFLNEPKQTELAKQKHCVYTMHTRRCVTFDLSFDTPQSNRSALFFCTKNSSIENSIYCPSVTIVWNKIGWKANINRGGGENSTCTKVTSCRRHVGPPIILLSDDIASHKKCHKKFSYKFMS